MLGTCHWAGKHFNRFFGRKWEILFICDRNILYVQSETYRWITSPSGMGTGLSVLSHSPLKAFTSQSLNSAIMVSKYLSHDRRLGYSLSYTMRLALWK
jgi:hypothetical protein